MKLIIDRLQEKVVKVLNNFKESQRKIKILENDLSKINLELSDKKKIIQEMKDKNKILKLSASLRSGEDTKATKKQINDLMREIDDCINLLNK